MKRIILHIDLNAFFARCEEIKDPSLVNKPVAIGGDGRAGIVSTCSYKAREYKIHSGMPMFQAKMLCKDLIVIPCDFKYYELMSKEFIYYIKQFTQLVEQASIDECYADITESYFKYGNNDINSFLAKIQNGLYKKTKLKCSIGVGSTKFLAKMGSDYKKPMGITIIRNKDIKTILFPLPIEDYYGIGKKTYPKLKDIGINTIGDLYYSIKNGDSKINNILGKFKDEIILELEGKSSSNIELELMDQKSIGKTHTFEQDSSSIKYIKSVIFKLFDEVYNDLKSQNKLCKTIVVTYKSGGHECDFKTKTFSYSLTNYTDNKEIISNSIEQLINKTYDGTFLRMAGITLKNFIDKKKDNIQLTFDNYEEYNKENKSILMVNKLNREYKKDIFFLGSNLKDK